MFLVRVTIRSKIYGVIRNNFLYIYIYNYENVVGGIVVEFMASLSLVLVGSWWESIRISPRHVQNIFII
jgi:hypothetical protein